MSSICRLRWLKSRYRNPDFDSWICLRASFYSLAYSAALSPFVSSKLLALKLVLLIDSDELTVISVSTRVYLIMLSITPSRNRS